MDWFSVRKKPVVVMARGPITAEETIETLEGTHHASVGDFIIRGVKGELYPIKPEIFWQTYEAYIPDDLIQELERVATSAYETQDSERNHRAFARSHLRIQRWLARQEAKP